MEPILYIHSHSCSVKQLVLLQKKLTSDGTQRVADSVKKRFDAAILPVQEGQPNLNLTERPVLAVLHRWWHEDFPHLRLRQSAFDAAVTPPENMAEKEEKDW